MEMKIKIQTMYDSTYAHIVTEEAELTARIDEPSDPAWCLRASAYELRRRAEEINKRADLLEQAACQVAANVAIIGG